MAIQYFTSVQALAHQVLSYAIRDALDAGHSVPCQDNPAEWDDPASAPTICNGCPVMGPCARYADTGAVKHGVIAGRRI
jgi:hypothetical protein